MSRKALLGLAFLGWVLRLVPCLYGPLDYDEGVYYASSALWVRGCWPYRDFVFAHPPGILYALMPFSWMNPDWGLGLARAAMTLIGALNGVLAARLSARCFGPQAGLLTGICYCIYPEAAISEHRLLLEPLLNTLILLSLLSSPARSAGYLGGAMGVKAWGALWWLCAWPRLGRTSLLSLPVAALLCLIPAMAAPTNFYNDVLLFQLFRPPHRLDPAWVRALDILDPRHLAITLLALWGWWNWTQPTPLTRQISRAWALLLLSLWLAPAHFLQYNAHLALPECLWAGAAWTWVQPRKGLWAVLLSIPLAFALVGWLKVDNSAPQRKQLLAQIPPQGTLYCFEPADGLRVGRLPDWGDGAPVVVDSYATMLQDAGQGFSDVPSAFHHPASQTRLRQRLMHSGWVLVEERAREQLHTDWLRQHFKPYQGELWCAR